MSGQESDKTRKKGKIPDMEIFEHRSGIERRKNVIPSLKYLLRGGRRHSVRRDTDRQKVVILDSYSGSLFAVIIVILCLSMIDAAMTLYLIGHGAKELNPIMDYFLQKGPLTFVIVKYCFTSVAVVVILLIKNTYLPRTRIGSQNLFLFAAVAFALVILWEILLYFMVVHHTH